MSTIRGKSFNHQEDQVLCLSRLEVSQDPILGTNKTKDKLWERITSVYHEKIKDSHE
ncbi:uncharacterized protein [Typha angustifolia]|uniref:uncharacterized protein n=1 Tax=Typha angustifolia TaxID=59011 RepID=UPI003C2ECBE6